jgi:hypothetical protein
MVDVFIITVIVENSHEYGANSCEYYADKHVRPTAILPINNRLTKQ